jgi:hypothetical protein
VNTDKRVPGVSVWNVILHCDEFVYILVIENDRPCGLVVNIHGY